MPAAADIPAYFVHLSKDRKLAGILGTKPLLPLKKKKNICLRLCASVMSQQLSTRVADIIFRRFVDLFDGKEPVPQQILDLPFETLRGIGLSNAKTHYVRNVAEYAVINGMDDRKLYRMSDEEVMNFLMPVKGVGQWTVEMLLMFALGREDIFTTGDLGIQQGMAALYGLDPQDKKQLRLRMLELSEHWAPYRTYACLHLWNHKDNAG